MPIDIVLDSQLNNGEEIKECSSVNALSPEVDYNTSAVKSFGRNIPTPWPINLIQDRWNNRGKPSIETNSNEKDDTDLRTRGTSRNSPYPSMGALFLDYAKHQARIGFRQVSEISAQIWYNLPPSAPPFLLLASIPRNIKPPGESGIVGMSSTASLRRIVPMFSDPFARSVVLAGLGIAVVSWSNQELQRKKKLTPLALSAMANDQGMKGCGRVSRVFLPPFLPENVPEPEIDALLGAMVDEPELISATSDELSKHGLDESILSRASPMIRRHLSGIYATTTIASRRIFRNYYKDWLQGRAARKREVAKIRRKHIFDELVALQALKKRQMISSNNSEINKPEYVSNGSSELGYALITGASRGIGRAIAVELARWEMPLVLVARDAAKLTQLASDLEACYGVRCCILEADLSKTTAAERIHKATSDAGISVDILINNAGVASEGLAIDTDTSFVERMVILNSLTYAKLSLLYGRDMKKRRRGRILMMSSMAGLCNASPNTAVYGACKAFGKSLALSMAKEMESYGVGVTCLIPGAVSGTDFRVRSGTHKALCWYLPFYPRSPEIIAHQGVVSLLDGDTQSIPGWQNRAFANIVRPIIPQRLEIMLVQLAFSPLRIPSLKNMLRHNTNTRIDESEKWNTEDSTSKSLSSEERSSRQAFKARYKMQPPPRILKLTDNDPNQFGFQIKGSNNGTLVNGSLSNEEVSASLPNTLDRKNSTKGESSLESVDLDGKVINQSDLTSSIEVENKRTEETVAVKKAESKMIEQQPASAEVGRGQKYFGNEKFNNSYDGGYPNVGSTTTRDGVKRKNDLNNIESRHLKHLNDEYKKAKPLPLNLRNEKTLERKTIKSIRESQWFGHDDDDDDDTFSTRLGPFTVKERRAITKSEETNTMGR